VLYYLDHPRTVCEIADRSDNYRNTVNRVLKRFRDRGLVGTADGRYAFNADFDRLHEFARELAHHLHRQRLEAVAPKGTILWEDDDEFLAQAETEIDAAGFHEPGLARFAAFDLQFLLTGHRDYLYSEDLDAVSPAELRCHTLLIDDGSRHRSYCLLLLSHVDVNEAALREQAATYGPEAEIDALLRHLETHGEVDDERLPKWDEFQELAADYEVPLS
jgi:DNA-binding MarR family transcriptional regulator